MSDARYNNFLLATSILIVLRRGRQELSQISDRAGVGEIKTRRWLETFEEVLLVNKRISEREGVRVLSWGLISTVISTRRKSPFSGFDCSRLAIADFLSLVVRSPQSVDSVTSELNIEPCVVYQYLRILASKKIIRLGSEEEEVELGFKGDVFIPQLHVPDGELVQSKPLPLRELWPSKPVQVWKRLTK